MIQIRVNGQRMQLERPLTLDEFVRWRKIELGFSAIALNMRIIAREKLADYTLSEDDSIDIITPMQGG
ncbi:MAG: sulfur carrier protein ThiS [Francisellaceae bacterium]